MIESQDTRTGEIAENLRSVRARIDDACRAAGRAPGEVTLIAVTKTYPAGDVRRLAELGLREVGENRDQEAAGKAEEIFAAGTEVHWHFVGQLQRNKCRSVVRYASAVHSVDSVRLVSALGLAVRSVDASAGGQRPLDVLIQVSLDGDAARGGVLDEDRPALLAAVAAEEGLRLRGVMAVAPLAVAAGEAFARLADIAASVRESYPGADWISAGMSGDLEEAIRHGSTHVRVGSALLGNRPPLR